MSETKLKPGWRWVKFGEVVHLNTDRVADPEAAGIERFIGLEHITREDLRIHSWGLVAEGTTFTNYFKPGQVLFGKRRAYQRKVALADFEGVCSSDIYVFEPKDPDFLLPELLPFICQTEDFYEYAVGTSAGSLSPRTNWSHLANYKFALPSLDEQRFISNKLLAIQNLYVSTFDLFSEVNKLRKATNYHYYSNILPFDDSVQHIKIIDLFTQITEKGFLGLPILSVTIDGEVVRRDSLERYISDNSGDEKYIRALPGDIAYNTMRLWQGAIGIVQEEGLISPAYTVMRRVNTKYPILYFANLFRSPIILNQYRRFVKGVASDRWRIYFKDLATISLNLPSPTQAEQIALEFEKIDDVTSIIITRLEKILELKRCTITTLLGKKDEIH